MRKLLRSMGFNVHVFRYRGNSERRCTHCGLRQVNPEYQFYSRHGRLVRIRYGWRNDVTFPIERRVCSDPRNEGYRACS